MQLLQRVDISAVVLFAHKNLFSNYYYSVGRQIDNLYVYIHVFHNIYSIRLYINARPVEFCEMILRYLYSVKSTSCGVYDKLSLQTRTVINSFKLYNITCVQQDLKCNQLGHIVLLRILKTSFITSRNFPTTYKTRIPVVLLLAF